MKLYVRGFGWMQNPYHQQLYPPPKTMQDISSRLSLCTTPEYDESLGFECGLGMALNMNNANANVFVLWVEKLPIPSIAKNYVLLMSFREHGTAHMSLCSVNINRIDRYTTQFSSTLYRVYPTLAHNQTLPHPPSI